MSTYSIEPWTCCGVVQRRMIILNPSGFFNSITKLFAGSLTSGKLFAPPHLFPSFCLVVWLYQ